jgi:uncharacterized protein
MVKQFFAQLWHAPRVAAVVALRAYQLTLSPDHGPLRHLHPYGYCRHEPTCSQYGVKVLKRRGFVLGTLLLTRRVLSCHPWKKPSPERMKRLLRN